MDSDQFRNLVVEYSREHEAIKLQAAALRDGRKRAKEKHDAILAHMKANGIDECAWTGGRLVRKHTKKTEGLKKEHIEGELRRLLGAGTSQDAVAGAVTSMYNRRLTDMQETVAVVADKQAEPT